jgi:hypothetical protein
VIRRGFWLTVGATAGIIGYRRVSAIGRRLSGSLTTGRADGAERAGRAGRAGGAARTAGLARETVRFARDVREGMELYLARHPGPPASTLDTSHDPRPKDGR